METKVAVVTGAASGIGKAVALKLAQNGASVMITDINEAQLSCYMNELSNMGYRVASYPCNITSEEKVKGLMARTVEEFGRIDILVNCAGISPVGRVTDITLENFQRTMDINVKAPFLTSKYALPYMIQQESGSIVNIAGTLGEKAIRSKAAYCASKGALMNLTRQMALDYGDYGIRVNSVSPGFADTPLNNGMENKTREVLIEAQPLHRVTEATDIAEAVAFVCSDAARRMTGANLAIDAGQSASQGSLSVVDYYSVHDENK